MAHVNEVPGYYYREYTGVSILSRVLALAQNWRDCVISFESTSKISEFPI